MTLTKAERKAMRKLKRRAFFRGFLFLPPKDFDKVKKEFWEDVKKYDK